MKTTDEERAMLTTMEMTAREFLTAFPAFSAVRFEARYDEHDGDHGVIARLDIGTRLVESDGTVATWDELTEEEAPAAWEERLNTAAKRGAVALKVDCALVVTADGTSTVDLD